MMEDRCLRPSQDSYSLTSSHANHIFTNAVFCIKKLKSSEPLNVV